MTVCLMVATVVMCGGLGLARMMMGKAPQEPPERLYVGRHIRVGQSGVYVPGWSLQRVVRHRARGGWWDVAAVVAGEWAPGDLIHA
jgi:hypothetical protein